VGDIKQKYIILYSIGIIPVMMVLFAALTEALGKTWGYIVSYGIYLVVLLCGVLLFHPQYQKSEAIKSQKEYQYYIAAFVPVLATFCVAFIPTVQYFSSQLFFLVAIYALVNGILEELFWRYTYNRVFPKQIVLAYIIPTIIFAGWHFSLLFAKGMSYHGGGFALIGGALFMGIIWGFVMYKTKNIKVLIAAHVLTNFFAFSQLIYQNWVA